MALSSSFLSLEQTSEKCLLCDGSFSQKDSQKSFSQQGWENLKRIAEEWNCIDIDRNDKYFSFRYVHSRIGDVIEAFGKAHKNCSITFGTKVENYRKRYGEIKTSVLEQESEDLTSDVQTRRSQREAKKRKQICFICNERREKDGGSYNQAGLGRCEQESSRQRIHARTELFISKPTCRFHEAAKRLQVLKGGQSFDLYAIDIYYHKNCYLKYAINQPSSIEEEQESSKDKEKQFIIEEFFRIVGWKVIGKKEAYLLHQLLSDIKVICEENNLEPAFMHTVSLKRELVKQFGSEIDFFTTGKYVIVHSALMNPCEYSVATLLGHGLRDMDHIRSFANFIKSKVKEREPESLPKTPDKMIADFNKGPMPELYNIIYATMYPNFKTNDEGYAITQSSNIANKIWSIASDWQSLITRQKNVKQAMLGLTIHRLTGSKEAAAHLHNLGHSISYNEIKKYNDAWSSAQIEVHKRFVKGYPLHSTIDNNDGRQETLTGVGTTHDTNSTLFQPFIPGDSILHETKSTIQELVPCEEIVTNNIEEYHLGARADPLAFPAYQDDEGTELLEESFRRDVAWSLASGLPATDGEPDLPMLGSWTAFNRKVSDRKQKKSLIEYMPVINQPPDISVCKNYLDTLKHVMDDLGLKHIFAHADEEVYARLVQIIWKNSDLYKNIIVLMGGFHQLRVRQRLIFKRHSCIGYKDWFVDAGTISAGSVDQAFGGKHYYRCMRILKESFAALVQYRTEQLRDNYASLSDGLRESLKSLRENPSTEALEAVIELDEFEELVREISSCESPQQTMTVAYLRDISSLLALVSAVREGNFERHLEAEREMLKQVFAFDHQNYSRYLTFQHVLLTDLKSSNNPAYQELLERGFGANYSGEKFATVHGDLVTEYFNRETKGTAGPFRSGFSTNIDTTNK
ncbi:uncharacterized protein LOC130657893 [Hydractinia symbiolongicarpus]|uniref:uncharacterized protein LOC130657893 n=1 Tax=Hydractinia symbiolongicarpus TaxID=13093 RepID=UPI00254CBCDE|nr:uncharacterized protein LOC130657893 [Hydractinia symbiolongicarpus]